MGSYQRKDRKAIHEDIDRIYDLFPRLNERHRQMAGTLSAAASNRCSPSAARS